MLLLPSDVQDRSTVLNNSSFPQQINKYYQLYLRISKMGALNFVFLNHLGHRLKMLIMESSLQRQEVSDIAYKLYAGDLQTEHWEILF